MHRPGSIIRPVYIQIFRRLPEVSPQITTFRPGSHCIIPPRGLSVGMHTPLARYQFHSGRPLGHMQASGFEFCFSRQGCLQGKRSNELPRLSHSL